MTTETLINRKELLLAALRHEKTEAVPWVPYAGVHAGKLKGYSAREVLTDETKMLESLLAVNSIYVPDGQPIHFDLQLEAEILGCELFWPDNAPPSVVTHPLEGDAPTPSRLPEPGDGRLPIILSVMRKMKTRVGDTTALYGLVTGPLTLASHLRGIEIFMDMIRNPNRVQELLAYSLAVATRVMDYYIDCGMDVIAVVDPLISQISPKHFQQFTLEPFRTLFHEIRRKGAYSSFFVCGDATKNIEIMCQTDPDCIAVDENINMVEAKKITDSHNITLSGNIPLTTRMLLGTQQDNMKYVVDFLDSIDHHNLILAPGCDMPYDTPIENTVGCMHAVRHPDETRRMLKNYQEADYDLDAVILPDYANLQKPLVELFTLDSATCAACSYMLQATEAAVSSFSGRVDMVEYKFTEKENVARVMKMGIKNLPSLLINGRLAYSSIIPGKQELVEEILKLL